MLAATCGCSLSSIAAFRPLPSKSRALNQKKLMYYKPLQSNELNSAGLLNQGLQAKEL